MVRLGKVLGVIALAAASGVGERSLRAANEPAVDRALQYLKARAPAQPIGEGALCALALIKGEVPKNDPVVAACLAKIRKRFANGVYAPDRSGGPDIYEAAVVAMLLGNLEEAAKSAELGLIASFLSGRQNANGSWDYANRTKGDCSISQYAILGLWEAENAGARVAPEVWDRAALWYLSVQGPLGSWNYHRDEANLPETVAMTAAGVGSLLICQRQLTPYRRPTDLPSALLVPLTPEGPSAPREVQVANARIDLAVRRGMLWIGANFAPANTAVMGLSPYYALYGLERIGALADRDSLGRVNWFDQGRKFILGTQQGDGSWTGSFGPEVNTVWAVFFLTRSTAKTLRRIEIKRLGAGTLLGGRGLPKDLSSMTVAGGKVVSRPMNGAIEGMLAVLEDPRAQLADSALAGMVARYEAQGPGALRPHKDRFRKLLTDRDPGLRRVAAWALGRTGDLDATPSLVEALTDPDEEVVATARLGLQLLSRKIQGLGPPSPSSPEQRRAAAQRWRAWYLTIRPLDLEGQEVDEPSTPVPAASPRSPR